MRVRIPSPLHSYTGGRSDLEARGSNLAEVLDDLDARHPGLRFRVIDEQGRIRPHIRFYVGGRPAIDLAHAIGGGDEVQIVCALSGG